MGLGETPRTYVNPNTNLSTLLHKSLGHKSTCEITVRSSLTRQTVHSTGFTSLLPRLPLSPSLSKQDLNRPYSETVRDGRTTNLWRSRSWEDFSRFRGTLVVTLSFLFLVETKRCGNRVYSLKPHWETPLPKKFSYCKFEPGCSNKGVTVKGRTLSVE